MKKLIRFAAFTALSVTASQALAFETEIERAGMLYFNVPLSNRTAAPTFDKSVMGLRFGQTRISTDSAGSVFTYFRTRPALFDVQFGMVGHKNSPEDIHFGLLDLKLTGISSIEKTYINGQAVVGGVLASKVLMGAAAVGGIGIAAAASSGADDDSNDDSSSQSSSASDNAAENHAENEHEDVHENEVENEHEHEAENEHEDEHEHEVENEHEEEHEHEAEDEYRQEIS